MANMIYYSIAFVKWEKEEFFMDVSTLERHALAMLKRPLALKDALLEVSDFRIDRRKKYPLYEILMVAVCAMVAGAKGPRFGALRAKCLNSRTRPPWGRPFIGRNPRAMLGASSQQRSVQWEADGKSLFAGCWLLAAGR